ncbi:MAG: serine/threonine protein kinase, partial [Cyanobacteria bacterium REEB65]|nr:serine/threonine protein kinase [Cyanobacteria bacterium REEB65]
MCGRATKPSADLSDSVPVADTVSAPVPTSVCVPDTASVSVSWYRHGVAELRTHQDLTERGESAIIGALLPLSSAYILLPHLVLPGQTWSQGADDVDVVVFGPGGAVLLDYHHWQGSILADPPPMPWRLRFPGGGEEERTNPVDVLEDKAAALVAYLSDRDVSPAKIARALVFPERSHLEGAISGVTVLVPGQVAEWVQSEVAAGAQDPTWTLRAADQIRPASPARLVNQYQITSVLERQSDQTSYLAYDTLSGRRVVLRELPYDPYQEPDQLEAVRKELLREAKLTMELDHPGVVRVERVIPKDDRYYVVSEYLDSCQTLRERLNQTGALSEQEAVTIAIQAAAALTHAHAKGVIHRDIRPENIVLAGQTAKISNFGLAKKKDLGTRPTFDLRKLASESPYSAPELRLGQESHHGADPRADVYSLGVVLYEMLTGQLPAHLDEKYFEPPSQYFRDLSPALDDIAHKALRFDPLQRFSTMNALRERLLQVRDNLPEHGDSPRSRYTGRRIVKRTPNSFIYQAQDGKLLRTVALKRIVIDPALPPEARRQQLDAILREAAVASHLVHPGIVHILDHFVEDDDAFIVMEWLDGQSVRDRLETTGGHLPLETILEILEQVANALAYAHSEGIIHRDVKPENLMLHHGRVTVLDFGIAAIPGWR